MYCTISNNLKEKTVKKLKNLEKELGVTLIAFECKNPEFAELKGKDLEKIQEFEKKHNLSLLAFK